MYQSSAACITTLIALQNPFRTQVEPPGWFVARGLGIAGTMAVIGGSAALNLLAFYQTHLAQ